MDNENGEATDDGLQDTYNRALFQLVMTGFKPGDVPAMVRRAYLGDETMPDWEAAPAATDDGYEAAWRAHHHVPASESTFDAGVRLHRQQQQAPGGLIQPCVTPPQAAILIPVRHTAVPAWRMALIEALAAVITRLS